MANAIILAAGLGSRFGTATKNISKTLLDIDGIPNIERTIQYLKNSGISDIYIVIGYLKEKFYYLEDKYGVKLIVNDKYDIYNNRYSMLIALEYFSDSYVIEGDVVFVDPKLINHGYSTYYTTVRVENTIEWVPRLNDQGFVIGMDVTDEKNYALAGVSYWNSKDALAIREEFVHHVKEQDLLNKSGYWDDIPVKIITNLNVCIEKLPTNALMEMDTWEQYEAINKFIGSR